MSVASEAAGFIRRNGLRTVVRYGLELYAAGLVRGLPGIEGFAARGFLYRRLFRAAGRDLYIYPGVHILFAHRMSVGDRVAINVGTYIDARGGVSIGHHVMIGPNCVLASCDHGFGRTDVPMSQQPLRYGEIVIGDDVWLGANVSVMRGVTIDKGSIVAAGCVVTRDVPPYTIYAGVPGRVVASRGEAAGDETIPG